MYWPKLPARLIRQRVFDALRQNTNYKEQPVLGIPATYLDQEQFYFDAPFLKDAAFLSVLVHNPNHIGCHTYSAGESYFSGTQQLERDLVRICAEEIFGAASSGYDGYVASGGTEANIQAQWIYRNYFAEHYQAAPDEIGLLFSEDVHYSAYKGCNMLGITPVMVRVNQETRQMDPDDLEARLTEARNKGIRYLIVHLSMGTTMFGSVDEPQPVLDVVQRYIEHYFVHVDAAFGGFIYPFTCPENGLDFRNDAISSITIDGHKMLQAPYGTGIFLCRKGLMEYTRTKEASYVQGTDFTICGSRSGANAIAVWMILMTHGSAGWTYRMQQLMDRMDHICDAFDLMGIRYYRNPYMNIVAIDAACMPAALARQYNLVSDNAEAPRWWKIVVMAHVEQPVIDRFLMDLRKHTVSIPAIPV